MSFYTFPELKCDPYSCLSSWDVQMYAWKLKLIEMQSRALQWRDGKTSISTSPNRKKKVLVSLFSLSEVYLFIYLFLKLQDLIACRTLRNSSGCLSIGLENTYCLFCEVIINIAIRGWDGHYFPPSNTTLLLGILKLNDCWLNHKSPQRTNNQLCQSCSYQYLPSPVVWVFQLMINWQDCVKNLCLWT